jgi:hypothetical protein
LRYCCSLLVAMRGLHWRHDSPRKRLRLPAVSLFQRGRFIKAPSYFC